jgi:glycosyltransferase involved in cell wall biosynthesis
MPSVLIVSNLFPPQFIGGAELVAHRDALALRSMGFDVSVFAGVLASEPSAQNHAFVEEVDELRVFRYSLQATGPDKSFFRPDVNHVFAQVLRVARPDIVHFHNLPLLGAGLIPLAREYGARVVVTLHDTWGFCLTQTRLRPSLQLCHDFTECDLCLPSVPDAFGEKIPVRLRTNYVKWCLEQADTFVSPSRSLLESYGRAGFPTERFIRVSNGVNLDAFPGRQRNPEGKVSFLCASSLAEHKGTRVLCEALGVLMQDRELSGRWEMTLGGAGPLTHEVNAFLDAHGAETPVQFVGSISRADISSYYARADVVVLPSICPENEPVTMLEAISSGAAQLGTRIGGIPELIEEGRTGFLVTPGDAGELASAMRRLILNPALVREFSARNLERRAEFDERGSVRQLTDLFTDPPEWSAEVGRPFVLCASAPDDGESLSRSLRSLDGRIQLLWHDWVDPKVRDKAELLWVFGNRPPFSEIGRAIRGAIPIVAPRSMALEQLPGCTGLVHPYDTVEMAVHQIERLVPVP